MLETLLRNHVLANLLFGLVLVIGLLSYLLLPRQQDPTINFNWIVITTVLPGAAALDVEQKVTDPLEDAIRNVRNMKFVTSNSRESVSSLLVRFEDIDARTFDKRINDLRREIQNAEDELPEQAEDPEILEITSANAFPSASIAVVGRADDENLRQQARNVEKDLERMSGVDRADPIGLSDPELQVRFDPAALEALGLAPSQLADTVSGFFQDIAAGNLRLGGQDWLVRLVGSDSDPRGLAERPVVGAPGEVTLGDLARVQRARERPATLARYQGRPAVLMAVMKKENANVLELVERIKAYLDERNALADQTGVELVLVDDQTVPTRNSIRIMQNNALIGLLLVLLVAWAFLGSRIALLTAIGIPFILAGTFWTLSALGETLNVTVLLGVVIVLGMLVDDAVVVVEAIYYRLRRGADGLQACLESLREVAKPVTTAVLTTMAAFTAADAVAGHPRRVHAGDPYGGSDRACDQPGGGLLDAAGPCAGGPGQLRPAVAPAPLPAALHPLGADPLYAGVGKGHALPQAGLRRRAAAVRPGRGRGGCRPGQDRLLRRRPAAPVLRQYRDAAGHPPRGHHGQGAGGRGHGAPPPAPRRGAGGDRLRG